MTEGHTSAPIMHELSEATAVTQEVVASGERKSFVTTEAYEQLRKWGVSDEGIDELALLSAQYEYNNVATVAEGVVGRGGYIQDCEYGDGQEVVLTDFYDADNRRTGQCNEITSKVMRDMGTSGWLTKVNLANIANGRPPILARKAQGTPGDGAGHFSSHLWIELVPCDDQKLNPVIIDAPLQRILPQANSDYEADITTPNFEDFFYTMDEVITIGELDLNNDTWPLGGAEGSLLGMTADYSLGLDLSYVKDADGHIIPALSAYDKTGENIACCVGDGERIIWVDPSNIIDELHGQEIAGYLRTLQNVPLVQRQLEGRHLPIPIEMMQ